ncbi:hypothetical protein GCM10010193_70010 [Kitasatospora atroaurantiaca]|uniref:Uncharacterized protein n=1 Tax=Kitasatospora atroaurantiaca TaxID=285545 RepID=A0A561EN95_9ACTN|nr:hypothetical protein [Kitasatospora atroaurantiaca]TWE17088.1 hypothetical protein FB465_2093 [Kitasatospora atroaurantiaca]
MTGRLFSSSNLKTELASLRKKAVDEVRRHQRPAGNAVTAYTLTPITLGDAQYRAAAKGDSLEFSMTIPFTGTGDLLEHRLADGFQASAPELSNLPKGDVEQFRIRVTAEGIDPAEQGGDPDVQAWFAADLEAISAAVAAINALTAEHNEALRTEVEDYVAKANAASEAAERANRRLRGN